MWGLSLRTEELLHLQEKYATSSFRGMSLAARALSRITGWPLGFAGVVLRLLVYSGLLPARYAQGSPKALAGETIGS